MSELPAPFVPANIDLRHYSCMSLDVKRLRDSRFAAVVSGEGFRCGLLLWAAAWHQVPAGSLPDDDIELCALAGFGRAVAQWREHRTEALYGWVKCSDGRLHHLVVAEKVVEAWNTTLVHRWKKEADRIRKENTSRKERNLPPLEMPTKPLEIQVGTPISGNLSEFGSEDKVNPESPETLRSNPEAADRSDPESPETLRSNPEAADRSDPESPETLRSNPEAGKNTPIGQFPAETRFTSNGNPAENALNGTQRNGTDISISCPKRASPLRTKRRYSEAFEKFWSGYPTDPNMSKAEACKVWDRLSEEDQTAAIAAVPGFVAYCRDRPDYRPVHAERFLRARRFDGFAPQRRGASPTAFEVRGVPVPEENALAALDRFKRGQPWHRPFGPAPGEPGCVVPQHLLERAGIAI